MKVTKHNVLTVACALLLVSALAPATAPARDKGPPATLYAQNKAQANGRDNRSKDDRERRDTGAQKEQPGVSRSEAAAIAERTTGGRVLSVRQSGRYWQVKVLVDEKRVRYVNVDMRSGRVN